MGPFFLCLFVRRCAEFFCSSCLTTCCSQGNGSLTLSTRPFSTSNTGLNPHNSPFHLFTTQLVNESRHPDKGRGISSLKIHFSINIQYFFLKFCFQKWNSSAPLPTRSCNPRHIHKSFFLAKGESIPSKTFPRLAQTRLAFDLQQVAEKMKRHRPTN